MLDGGVEEGADNRAAESIGAPVRRYRGPDCDGLGS